MMSRSPRSAMRGVSLVATARLSTLDSRATLYSYTNFTIQLYSFHSTFSPTSLYRWLTPLYIYTHSTLQLHSFHSTNTPTSLYKYAHFTLQLLTSHYSYIHFTLQLIHYTIHLHSFQSSATLTPLYKYNIFHFISNTVHPLHSTATWLHYTSILIPLFSYTHSTLQVHPLYSKVTHFTLQLNSLHSTAKFPSLYSYTHSTLQLYSLHYTYIGPTHFCLQLHSLLSTATLNLFSTLQVHSLDSGWWSTLLSIPYKQKFSLDSSTLWEVFCNSTDPW